MISPEEIQNKVFDVKVRGYDREQVDAFLFALLNSTYEMQDYAEEMRLQMEELKAQAAEWKRKAEEQSAKLELAQYQLEEQKKNAQIVSQRIINEANEMKRGIDYEYLRRQEQISEFKAEIEKMRAAMRGNCRKLLEFLDTFDNDINQ